MFEHYLGLAQVLKGFGGTHGKGDYVHASEKLWGATAEMVKKLAAKRSVELETHGTSRDLSLISAPS